MNVKSRGTSEDWVDPDDAPELDDKFFERGVWRIGDRIVSREEVQAAYIRDAEKAADETSFVSASVPLDSDVLVAFEAMGEGWQVRLNEVLRQWLRSQQ